MASKSDEFDAAFEAAPKADPFDAAFEKAPPAPGKKYTSDDVVVKQTPTGPASMTSDGRRRVLTSDEIAANFDTNEADFKTDALKRATTFFNSGGRNIAPYALGAIGAVKRQTDPATSKESLIESFRHAKDSAQSNVDDADKASGLGWQMAGQVPGMLVGAPASVAGRLAVNAGTAGVEAFTRSKNNLDTEEGRAGLLRDTGFGTGVGGLAAAGGEVIGGIGGAASRALSNRSSVNAAKVAANDILAQTQKGQSLSSSAGGVAGNVSRAVKSVQEVLEDPNATEAELSMAKRIAASPEYAEAVSRQRINAMSKFFGAANDTKQFAQQASEALTDVPGKAAPITAAKLDPWNAAKDLGGKAFKSVGQRAALGVVGAYLGNKVGGDNGGLAGGAMGALGAPGALQFARNTMKNPAYASIAQRGLSSLVGGISGMGQQTANAVGRYWPQGVNDELYTPASPPQKTKDQRDEEAIQALLDGT